MIHDSFIFDSIVLEVRQSSVDIMQDLCIKYASK